AGVLSEVDSPEGTVRYSFDSSTGDLENISTDATSLHYAYNQLGALLTTTAEMVNGQILATPLTTSYTYTATGTRASKTLPNGVVVTYQYDANDKLIKQISKDSSGAILSQYDYVNNASGLRIQATEASRQSNGTLGQAKISYTYDSLGRLTKE